MPNALHMALEGGLVIVYVYWPSLWLVSTGHIATVCQLILYGDRRPLDVGSNVYLIGLHAQNHHSFVRGVENRDK